MYDTFVEGAGHLLPAQGGHASGPCRQSKANQTKPNLSRANGTNYKFFGNFSASSSDIEIGEPFFGF